MTLLEQIQADMIAAMKAKDELRLNTLRSVKTALDRYRTDQRKPADETASQGVLNTLAKQRRESADAFRGGNRPEMADREEAELVILKSYMPADATEAEIDVAIEASLPALFSTGPKAMGMCMKETKLRLTGKRVDGKVLSDKIKARLAAAEATGETLH